MINNMTAKELKAMAKELKVKNWWTLKKAELIAGIEAAQNIENEPESVEEVTNEEPIAETAQNESENDQNNGWELIAKKQLKNAYDWYVGQNENAVTDGEMTQEEFDEWIQNDALKVIYREAISTEYHEDACGGDAPKEMRFAGKKFCIDYLKRLFKNDGYKVNEEEKKQRGKDLIEYDGRTQNLSQWAKELGMPGQTLFARIHISGWTVEKAFTTPVKTRKKKEEEA